MEAYHLLGLVGEGSYGQVYKGRKKQTGELMALKFITKVGKSSKDLLGLCKEIDIMKGLKHPNIVELVDSFETEYDIVIVTNFAEGELFQIVRDEGKLSETEMREIACQLVSALYYLHNHRIVHRDIKPQNILLGKDHMVKLCDFGFARAMSVSTLVLTSIKGTPLYMAPELIQGNSYNHTSDLWSLGCVLFELHTGMHPFFSTSMFQLMQLIVSDQIKWPDTMTPVCLHFLKGLLTRDPKQRLSWPALLHHPFVASSGPAMPNLNITSPLTVVPNRGETALKNSQAAEKTLTLPERQGKLFRKIRKLEKCRGTQSQCDSSKLTGATGGEDSGTSNTSTFASCYKASYIYSSNAPNPMLFPPNTDSFTRQRGQISIDYETEFPAIDVRPEQMWKLAREGVTLQGRTISSFQDSNQVSYWKKLSEDTSVKIPPPEQVIFIIPRIQAKIESFQTQFKGGTVQELELMYYPMRVLHTLLMSPDQKLLEHVIRELHLPWVLFDLIGNCVETVTFFKWGISTLGEITMDLFICMERQNSWVAEASSLDDLIKPFKRMLKKSNLSALRPLAASVLDHLSHYTHVDVPVKYIAASFKCLLMDSSKLRIPSPPGKGLCDGLFSLLLHNFYQNETASLPDCLNSVLLANMWRQVSAALNPPDLKFYSVKGLHDFLAITMCIFSREQESSYLLFTDPTSNAVMTLTKLVGNKCMDLFTEETPLGTKDELTRENLTILSAGLLCFPLSMALPSSTFSKLLHLYEKCGIIQNILEAIQALPISKLEIPLTLMSHLLSCDCERFLGLLLKDGIFLSGPDSQPFAYGNQDCLPRTIYNLLPQFMQHTSLLESAAQIFTISANVAQCSLKFAIPSLNVEVELLQQGVVHQHEDIRAASCRLLGNLDPFTLPLSNTKQNFIFKAMIKNLSDNSKFVRRYASGAVGKWLDFIVKSIGTTDLNVSLSDARRDNVESPLGAVGGLAAGGLAVVKPRVPAQTLTKWVEEGLKSISSLAALVTESDVPTRCNALRALGNVVKLDGGVALIKEYDVHSLLVEITRNDREIEVKNTAVNTLGVFTQEYEMFEVQQSLDVLQKQFQSDDGL